MRSISIAAIAIGLCLFTASCRKESPSDASHQSAPCGQFDGILRRDINGTIIPMQPDWTDWLTTDDWCPEAEALFRPVPGLSWAAEDTSALFAALPNPAQSQFMFVCVRDSAAYVDVRVVRENMQVLFQLDSLTEHRLIFDLAGASVAQSEVIRVYYRIVHPDGTANRGHGDVERAL